MRCWRIFQTVFGSASLVISFLPALDENTDASEAAQLAVFTPSIDSEFTIIEELLSLVPMKGTTTGNDLFDTVLNVMVDFNLDYKLLKGITAD